VRQIEERGAPWRRSRGLARFEIEPAAVSSEDIDFRAAEGTNDPNLQISQIETFINEGVDAIVAPTIATEVPRCGVRSLQYHRVRVPVVFGLVAETCQFNSTGHPALAMPLRQETHGIPHSLQLVTRPNRELDALELARHIETMPAS